MENEAKKMVTIEGWLGFPDRDQCELIKGHIVYKDLQNNGYLDTQKAIDSVIKNEFQWKRKGCDGWWIRTDVKVIYDKNQSGFIHSLAAWKKENSPEKQIGNVIIERPDWVCEIYKGYTSNKAVDKKWIMHEHKVPFYWSVNLEDKIISIHKWMEQGYLCLADVSIGNKKILTPFDIEFDVSIFFGIEQK